LGIGDWGLGMGIGDWGLGPIPQTQSPNPHTQIIKYKLKNNKKKCIKKFLFFYFFN